MTSWPVHVIACSTLFIASCRRSAKHYAVFKGARCRTARGYQRRERNGINRNDLVLCNTLVMLRYPAVRMEKKIRPVFRIVDFKKKKYEKNSYRTFNSEMNNTTSLTVIARGIEPTNHMLKLP